MKKWYRTFIQIHYSKLYDTGLANSDILFYEPTNCNSVKIK